MAGDHGADELNITGWKKYYNTFTTIGRRNIALSTYGGILVGFLYYKFGRRSPVKSEIHLEGMTPEKAPSDTIHKGPREAK